MEPVMGSLWNSMEMIEDAQLDTGGAKDEDQGSSIYVLIGSVGVRAECSEWRKCVSGIHQLWQKEPRFMKMEDTLKALEKKGSN